MDIRMRLRRVRNLLALSVLPVCLLAQSTTGTISGSIVDAQQAVIPGAMVTARNVETNISRSVLTNEVGRFRIPNLPVGPYEVSVELGGFARYVRSGIILTLNQEAVLDIMLQTAGVNFSVNGTRFRSNNFMIDGQDTNEPGVSGRAQSINNPDIVQEIRLITNQFAAEYGRAAGSIMNIVTKSGSNDLHGTAFWFHNDNALNAPSNLDKKRSEERRVGKVCKKR